MDLTQVLFIGDTEGFRDIYRNEGQTPQTFAQPPFQLYMKLHDVKRGLYFM